METMMWSERLREPGFTRKENEVEFWCGQTSGLGDTDGRQTWVGKTLRGKKKKLCLETKEGPLCTFTPSGGQQRVQRERIGEEQK